MSLFSFLNNIVHVNFRDRKKSVVILGIVLEEKRCQNLARSLQTRFEFRLETCFALLLLCNVITAPLDVKISLKRGFVFNLKAEA